MSFHCGGGGVYDMWYSQPPEGDQAAAASLVESSYVVHLYITAHLLFKLFLKKTI